MGDDNSRLTELTRRRILGSVVTVGAASSAAGAGTLALFSDTETSSRNTVQAGTLDLTVGGSGSNTVINVSNVTPGATGSDRSTLRNDGSLPGLLQFGIQNVESRENGVNEPEADDSDETDPIGAGSGDDHSGELAQALDLKLKLEPTSGSDIWLVGDASSYVPAGAIRLGAYDIGNIELSPSETIDIVAEYRVGPAGNEIQSDSVVIDAVFGLAQQADQAVLPKARTVSASAIGTSSDEANGKLPGVEFDLTNQFGRQMTITDIHVQPDRTDLTLLSDNIGGGNYDDYSFNSDVHIETPSGDQDGWVDGDGFQFPIPGWVDLAADGYGGNDGADQVARLSAGSTATVRLYAFRDSRNNKTDMVDEPLRVTLDVTLGTGDAAERQIVPLVMTPQ